ncbi:TRAP transporter small permease [Pelagibius sp. CAU 1746]|uniref:TRAP transporter small permease n=1 Tax=Pelagibius sp. CAU 1746 TaxID=3140370 RepID=UPI00325C1E98
MNKRAFRLGLRLANLTEILAAILLVAVIAMNLAQVFFRYVLVDPLSWSEETMRYSTTWMVFLAAGPALFRGEHMVINLFSDLRSAGLRRLAQRAVLICIGAFCVLLMWQGFPAAIDNMRQVSPAVRIPMTIPYLAIPVGATLMLIKVACLMFLPDGAFASEDSEEKRP